MTGLLLCLRGHTSRRGFALARREPRLSFSPAVGGPPTAAARTISQAAATDAPAAPALRGRISFVSVTPPRLSSQMSNSPSSVNKAPPVDPHGPSPAERTVGGGRLHPESVDPFQPQPKRRMDLKLGPYAGGRFFVSPKEDPKEFILCVIIVSICLYTLVTTYTQPGGETVFQRRRRIIRERLMKEAGITQADLDELEAEEAPLS
ncbi:uncharacterized protein LOC34622345 [Cyclospora cayetanensis]|uniref:Uncharacterized protein LOC34622345 n=1 Tax=Cyclospora cayetanensis TaxID=88456 RepID=A0A6P5WEE7_9EIME|nr:uncharacterized protein LOC34622345 [Cyclospora cayetanensis]